MNCNILSFAKGLATTIVYSTTEPDQELVIEPNQPFPLFVSPLPDPNSMTVVNETTTSVNASGVYLVSMGLAVNVGPPDTVRVVLQSDGVTLYPPLYFVPGVATQQDINLTVFQQFTAGQQLQLVNLSPQAVTVNGAGFGIVFLHPL
jgi:hypothetical protein